MNREDIIAMAREAGVRAAKLLHEFGTEGALCDSEIQDLKAAERLAEAAYTAGAAAAKAEEREACAKVCDEEGLLWGQRYAAAIRARGQA